MVFVTESLRLVGWLRLLMVVAGLCAVGALATHIVARFLFGDRRSVWASISSAMALALVGFMAAAICTALFLRGTEKSGEMPSAIAGAACMAMASALVFLGVKGGFAASPVKAVLLTMVLVGSVGGTALATAGMAFQGQASQLSLLADQVTGKTDKGPWLIESPTATKRIKIRWARLERLKLETELEDLTHLYASLQAERAHLNSADAAAVAAFNEKAANYAGASQALKTRRAEVEALLAEGDAAARKE